MTNCKEFRLNNAIVCPYNIFMVLCSKLKIFARCLTTSLTVTVKQREKLKRSLGVNQWKWKLKSPRLGGLCTTCYQTSTGLGRLDLRRSPPLSPVRSAPLPKKREGFRRRSAGTYSQTAAGNWAFRLGSSQLRGHWSSNFLPYSNSFVLITTSQTFQKLKTFSFFLRRIETTEKSLRDVENVVEMTFAYWNWVDDNILRYHKS